jgi:hypothetical protein
MSVKKSSKRNQPARSVSSGADRALYEVYRVIIDHAKRARQRKAEAEQAAVEQDQTDAPQKAAHGGEA